MHLLEVVIGERRRDIRLSLIARRDIAASLMLSLVLSSRGDDDIGD